MNKSEFCRLIDMGLPNIRNIIKTGVITVDDDGMIQPINVTNYIKHLKGQIKVSKTKTKDIKSNKDELQALRALKIKSEIERNELKKQDVINEIYNQAYYDIADLINNYLINFKLAISNNNKSTANEIISDIIKTLNNQKQIKKYAGDDLIDDVANDVSKQEDKSDE